MNPDELDSLRRRAGLPAKMPGDPTPEEVAEYMTDLARERLDEVTPAAFRGPIPADERIEAWVRSYIDDPAQALSLLLIGPTGSGKTHQAYSAVRSAVLGCYAKRVRPRWRMVDHATFADRMRPSPGSEHLDWFERYTSADLLLFDDLGAVHAKDWGLDRLQALVDHRWRHALPTIWTTNLNASGLTERFGDRVVSRLWSANRISFATQADHRRAS